MNKISHASFLIVFMKDWNEDSQISTLCYARHLHGQLMHCKLSHLLTCAHCLCFRELKLSQMLSFVIFFHGLTNSRSPMKKIRPSSYMSQLLFRVSATQFFFNVQGLLIWKTLHKFSQTDALETLS